MLIFFILFLNCQQPETKSKTKIVEVPVESIKSNITFDKQGGTGGSDNETAIYGSTMCAATAPVPTKEEFDFIGYWDAIIRIIKFVA